VAESGGASATFSNPTPSTSLTIWARNVAWPWPCETSLEKIVTVPSVSSRTRTAERSVSSDGCRQLVYFIETASPTPS
jgi:hypothetical protein